VKRHLILKLLAINLVVIAFVMVVVWISIDTLAAGYFVVLMEKYNISPKPAHAMFISAVHRYLLWASLSAVILAVLLSFVMMRRVLAPLTRMTAISREIAAGNFTVRAEAVTVDEVGQLARAFNRMSESLEKMENLRRTLMIDVAHELRTTLRLVQLVEDVLQLARADAARGNLKLETVDLREIVKKALEPFSHMFSQNSITVRVHIPEESVRVIADRDRIARVLRNLTDNTSQYTPKNGEVEVRIEIGSGKVRIDYINSIDELIPQDLPYIFERFYRGEKSRSRQHGGAGIGLAIVKELVEAHGGRVGAELLEGRIRIRVELPLDPTRSTD
jgi:signal transduction histidine kinase